MKESIKTFPEIKNFKQHSHDCIVWKMAFEKQVRDILEEITNNPEAFYDRMERMYPQESLVSKCVLRELLGDA